MSTIRMKAIIDANILLGVGKLTSTEKSEYINRPLRSHSSTKVSIVPMFTITPAPKKG